MASTRPRACVRGQRICSVSCTSRSSEAGDRQSRPEMYRMWLCQPAVASRRRCWWLCRSSSARRPGRVDCRPRGRPQWQAPGATDADATRHQVGARPSDLDHPMTRRAGYPGMAVRPDESIFPRSCVVPAFSYHQRGPNPVLLIILRRRAPVALASIGRSRARPLALLRACARATGTAKVPDCRREVPHVITDMSTLMRVQYE